MHVTADRRNFAVDEFGAKSEPARLGIDLQCPRCKLELAGLECKHCGFQIRVLNGVLHALPPERVVHHARFVEVYERTRRLMLSGSLTDEYYLGLPYTDASRQNPAHWSMRARSFDCMLRRVLKPGVPVGARILDLGAGNCWLSYRLALADYQPFAIDLLTNDADGLGAAEHYREYLPEFFPRIRAEFAHLPFQPDQFHAAIFNASFHYAEDFETTLREALRCCRQNGIAIICDSPWFQGSESGAKAVADEHRQIVRSVEAMSDVHHGSEYLTDQFLRQLENRLQIRWTVHTPKRTFGAAIEPWIARLLRRPEPPRFRIYVARKTSL